MEKRNSLLTLVLCLSTLVFFSCGSSKSSGKKYDEVADKLQEYATGGWAVHGTSHTLRAKLTEHYAKLAGNADLVERTGTSTGCRSITVCRAAAINSASMELAKHLGQVMKGSTMADMGFNDASQLPEEYNKFQEACISKYQASIRGILEESYAIIQRRPDGTNVYEIVFLLDKKLAQQRWEDSVNGSLNSAKMNQELNKVVINRIKDTENAFKQE